LSDFQYDRRPAVRIPYVAADGGEVAIRFRLALDKSENGDGRFKWKNGSKPILYGLWRSEEIKKPGYVVLVEGESDCHTLWFHGETVLGVPGAGTWKEAWAEYLDGVKTIYAVIEPDKGGEMLRGKLGASSIRDRLRLVDLGEHKDVSGLYLSDPENFAENWLTALSNAVAWAEREQVEAETRKRSAWAKCESLAREERILDCFAEELARSGVAGESRSAKLLYLAVTSRFLDCPVSVAVKGPSSGGKSYLTERVLSFFRESAYYALTAMSEHALAYGEEPLSHRFLVIYEAAGMSSDLASYLVRSLLSEGRIRYETVEKTSEGIKPRLIEREGPTGLIVTTTAVKLHPENETRLLSLNVTDTQEQTRAVLLALANEGSEPETDLEEWRALQEWLGFAECRVTIPYRRELAGKVPPLAVRLRRDFAALLNLIRAHAILHRASRERDTEGRIVATLEDYAVVRELVSDLVSEGIGATVPPEVRETVEAVERLYARSKEEVMNSEVARELELDKSTASRRVQRAEGLGYLRNLENRQDKPKRLVPANPLPDDTDILPTPGELRGCTVAALSG
jgi:hypothetical protein